MEIEAQLAVDFLEGDVGVHEPGVGARGLEDGPGLRQLVVDVAGDFLEDVAAGDDAGGPAVFVDDDGDADLVLLEAHEQAVEVDALGHEDGRDRRGGDGVGGIEQELADVEEADDVVELVAVEAQEVAARAAGDGDGILRGIGEIEAEEIDARRHDVGGVEILEIDDGLDHREFVGVEDALLAGDVEDGFEFLFGQGLAQGAEEGREAPADELEREAQRRQRFFGEAQGRAVEPDDGGRVEETDVLGADLAEEDQQQGDGGNGDGFGAGRRPALGKQVAHVGEGQVHERVADEDGGQQARGIGQQGAQALAGGRALLGDAPELDGIDGEIGRFGAGAERGTRQQQQEQQAEQQRRHGRAPGRPAWNGDVGFTFRNPKLCV